VGLTGWTWREKEIVKGKKFNIMMMTTTFSHTPDMEDNRKTRGFVEKIYTHTYVHTHTLQAHIVSDTHTHERTCSKIPGIDTQTRIERECEREHIDTGARESEREKRGRRREGEKERDRRGKEWRTRENERGRGEKTQVYTSMNTHMRHTHTNTGTPICIESHINKKCACLHTQRESERGEVSEKRREEAGERKEREVRKKERENDRVTGLGSGILS
jgi:hypothetical protein